MASLAGASLLIQAPPSSSELARRSLVTGATKLHEKPPHFAFPHGVQGTVSFASSPRSVRISRAAPHPPHFAPSAAVAASGSILGEDAFRGVGGYNTRTRRVPEDDEEDDEEGSGDVDFFESDEERGSPVADNKEIEISKLGLPQKLVSSLEKRGISQLFPIQRAVFVPALEGRDLIARAKTGTGKTLAFGIPIIKNLTEDDEGQDMSRRSGRPPRVLVLAPTRELAKQVEKEIKESAPYLETACVYGGVSYNVQQNALYRGVDVVVGTPGRLIDLINNGVLKLGEVKYLVLDEADQMLTVGFEEDVEAILEKLPSERQSMLFSATMPGWVKKLSRKHLNNPLTIDLVGDEEEKLAEGIKLYAMLSNSTSKRIVLSDLITVYAKGGKAIIFTKTKLDADEVSMALANRITCEALHGDISQHQRERTLNGFRKGKFTALVATDVAARGLDIPNVDLVIHYELPNDPETFVHRSGRTGRAGKAGITILMFTSIQRRSVKALERDVGCRFEFICPPQMQEVLESSAEKAVVTLQGVHPESVQFFLPTAEKLSEELGMNALAAALAHLSGFSQPPSCRSLITHEQGWVTLQLSRDSMSTRGLFSERSVTGFLSDVCRTAADEVGKIHLIADDKVHGAVFDLPEETATDLLSMQLPSGNTIIRITKLPALQDDGPATDDYGRFSNRERYSRGGGGYNRGRGSRGPRNWGGGRNSYSDGDFRRGGRNSYGDGDSRRGGRSSGTDNAWPRNSRGSWGEEDSLIRSGGRTSRSDYFRSQDRGFVGTCFNCGMSGHRSGDCPNK